METFWAILKKKKFQIKNATHKLFEKLVSFLFLQQVTRE